MQSVLLCRQGHSPVAFPRILGIEAVGIVKDAPGTKFAEGDVVATAMGGMGRDFDGGYAEFTVVPSSQVQASFPSGIQSLLVVFETLSETGLPGRRASEIISMAIYLECSLLRYKRIPTGQGKTLLICCSLMCGRLTRKINTASLFSFVLHKRNISLSVGCRSLKQNCHGNSLAPCQKCCRQPGGLFLNH